VQRVSGILKALSDLSRWVRIVVIYKVVGTADSK
jgi:hypothetical protein